MCGCHGDDEHDRKVAEYQKKLAEMEKSRIIAGPSEPTFEEKHGIKLHLPLAETDFLCILDALKLSYNVFAERGTDVPIPKLWHSEGLTIPPNLDDIQKVYQIIGEVNRGRHSQEVYRAYVDKNGSVVYLENTYSYAPP